MSHCHFVVVAAQLKMSKVKPGMFLVVFADVNNILRNQQVVLGRNVEGWAPDETPLVYLIMALYMTDVR